MCPATVPDTARLKGPQVPQARLFGGAAEHFFGVPAVDLATDQQAAGHMQSTVDHMLGRGLCTR